MCLRIISGDEDIETIGNLKKLIGPNNTVYAGDYADRDDSCLCVVDVHKTLTEAGIRFRYEQPFGDFFVETTP